MDKQQAMPDRTERDFAQAMARYERDRRTLAQDVGLGAAELRLLWLLNDNEPRTLRRIGDELRLEQSTVNRQVNAALQAGIVRRTRQPGDAAYLIASTPEGTDRLGDSLDTMFAGYRRAFASMGDERARELVALLTEFADAYEAVASTQAEQVVDERDSRASE